MFSSFSGRVPALVFVSTFAFTLATAQSTQSPTMGAPFNRNPIQGELIGFSEAHRLFVEIADPSNHVSMERVTVGANGSFRFYSPPPEGAFEVRVLNEVHEVVHREWVSAGASQFPVSIQFKTRNESPQLPGGSISAYRLSHKVPKKAMQEFQKADQAYKKQRLDEAIEHLRRSVAIDPGFLEGLNNLGGRLMEKDQPEEAATHFRKAAELDPSSSMPLVNLGLALVRLGRPAEAERIVRRALAVDHGSERAGRVLNLTLRAQGKQLPASSFR